MVVIKPVSQTMVQKLQVSMGVSPNPFLDRSLIDWFEGEIPQQGNPRAFSSLMPAQPLDKPCIERPRTSSFRGFINAQQGVLHVPNYQPPQGLDLPFP